MVISMMPEGEESLGADSDSISPSNTSNDEVFVSIFVFFLMMLFVGKFPKAIYREFHIKTKTVLLESMAWHPSIDALEHLYGAPIGHECSMPP
jgi:hypothetical protein